MKKRVISITLALLIGGTLLTGCGGNSNKKNSTGKTEITFWHSMGGEGGETLNRLTEEFNNSQDKIKVVTEYQGEYDDAINKLKSSALSNSGPDLMQLYDIGTKWMIDSGYAIAMQDLIDRNKFDTSKLEKNILDYYTVDGKLYSMPFNSSTPILYYNKDAFKEANLDVEITPKNFDEIIEYSKKLVKTSGGKIDRYGYAMQIYGWFFEQFLIKEGLDYIDNENGRKDKGTKVVFDSNNGAIKIMEGWKRLIDSGVVGNFGRKSDNTIDAFAAGKTAMIIASTASLTNIKGKVDGKFELGTGYLPAVNSSDKGGVSIGGASLWAMDKGNQENEDAVFEFVKFLVSKESQAKWAKGTGYFSVTTEAYEIPEMIEHLEKNPEFKTAINQLRENNNKSGSLMGVFPEARAIIESNIEKLINNEITAEQAVENSAKIINEALKKYNKK